jgi:hypothetical protein
MAKSKESFKEIGTAIGSKIDKEIEKESCGEKKIIQRRTSGAGAVYGLGLIGALIYFISHATGFWMGVLGVLKAIVWPVLLVYKFLGMAGM